MRRSCISCCRAAGRKRGDGMSDVIKDVLMGKLFGTSGTSSGGGGAGGGGGIPQEDIDAAFAALAEKGVTVPDGATSADLDELIASIVTGGGGKTATGTITVSENTYMAQNPAILQVQHNLGAIPTGLVLYYDCTKMNSVYLMLLAEIITESAYMSRFYINGSSSIGVQKKDSTTVYVNFTQNADETNMMLSFASGSRISGEILAGTTITWVAWV